MTVAEHTRLIAILSRLDSPFDGERAAAGLLASRMLKTASVGWADLIPTKGEISRRHNVLPADSGWRADLALCQRHRSFITKWEQDFVWSVAPLVRVTPKQRAILAEIATKLRTRGHG